ncbi:MAG: hypothetical protein K1X78_26390 [Verrucomicrobiaceae bacterium]|nr:hypothetical protein [Verrucomicrobiaceae bacterium]
MTAAFAKKLVFFSTAALTTPVFAAATAPISIAPPEPGVTMDFQRDVYPILKANCIACHNKTTTKADLNMETPALMKKGGESGVGILPGRGADSIILQAAAHTWDSVMPPKGNKVGAVNLTPRELGVLKAWIDQGAKASEKHEQQIAWQPLPPGLNPIYSLAMTKDGRFAACSRANQIFIYDLATRQFVTRLTDDALIKQDIYKNAGVAHRDLVQSLAFSPDGARLASGSFREVKIWRHEKGAPVTRKAGLAAGPAAARLSADARQIVSTDKSGALLVLDAASGKVLKTISNVNAAGIKLIAIAPDSSKAAVHGADGALAIWNLQDGRSLAVKPGVTGVRALTWTRDGKAVATAGEDKIIRVWPLPEGAGAELSPAKELKGATGAINVLETGAGPDHLLTAGDDGIVRLWSIAGGKVAREFKIAGVASLALSIDGRQLAAGCGDGAVRIWDAQTPKQVAELRGDLESTRRMAALDWEIAARTMDSTFQTAEIARIDADTKALDDRLKKSNDAIAAGKKALPDKQKAVKPAQDAKAAAQKAAGDVTAELAKAPGGKPDAALEKKNKEAQDKLMAAVKAEETAVAAVKTAEDQIKDAEAEVKIVSDARTKNTKLTADAKAALDAAKQAAAKATADLTALKTTVSKDATKPLAVGFSADGQQVAAALANGSLRAWSVTSGAALDLVEATGSLTGASVAWESSGSWVVCGADSTTTRVPAAAKWALEKVLGGEMPGSPFVDRVTALRFSPDGRTLAAGGGEPSRTGDILLWETAAWKLAKKIEERHSDSVLSIDFSPDGRLLASGGADKAVRITDIASGGQVRLFEGHTHHVLGVSFRADGRILASSGADNVVKIWDMITGDRKKNIDGWDKEVTSLQFIGATDQLLTSAGDNRVRLVRDSGAEVRSIAGLPDFMHGAAGTATASVLIGGGQDSVLRVWDGATGKEMAAFAAK